ncbi:MAG: hypothetical protein U0234_00570 [Sandaracinus sp.]
MEQAQSSTDPRHTTRVAELLGVELDIARELPPYDPRDETRPALRRGARGKYRHAAEIDALLAPFTNDAIAGVPDALLARRVGVSFEQVKHWRRRRHIQGRRGRAPTAVGTNFMLGALLGEPTEPVAHEISPTHGQWRPPAYALRRPLSFGLFARMIAVLVESFTVDQIAQGFGFEERDVALALALWTERGAS